jgi:hypothetical protein
MASRQSRVARFIVRVTVRRRLQRHQTSLEDQSRAMRRTLAIAVVHNARVPKDVTILPTTLGEWVIPRGAALEGRAILYMQRIPQEGIIFAGDSAGGNLALATLLALRERDGNPKPCAGVIAMSPWTDLGATGPSAVENAKSDDVLAPPKDVNIALAYADAAEFTNPLVSPLYGQYAAGPPILLFASTIEMLRDDSTRLAELGGRYAPLLADFPGSSRSRCGAARNVARRAARLAWARASAVGRSAHLN